MNLHIVDEDKSSKQFVNSYGPFWLSFATPGSPKHFGQKTHQVLGQNKAGNKGFKQIHALHFLLCSKSSTKEGTKSLPSRWNGAELLAPHLLNLLFPSTYICHPPHIVLSYQYTWDLQPQSFSTLHAYWVTSSGKVGHRSSLDLPAHGQGKEGLI